MTFWIQHGYGKATKIDAVDDAGLLTGVILSPADEQGSTLEATVDMLRTRDVEVLLDPQLYIHTIPGAVARCHDDHGLDFGELSWLCSPNEIEEHVQAVIAANKQLGIEKIIAPCPYQASFGDVWTSLSLQYAQATIAIANGPVYISLVAEDIAFADWHTTREYLDFLTTLDAAGIYLIVGTSAKTYPFMWEPDRLANILRVVYTLAEFNLYDVVWGYSDLAGVIGLTVGCSGAATGWYNSLRMWTTEKWVPKSGGRQATPRIFVEPLLSAIERNSEGVSIARTRIGTRVFPDPDERKSLRDMDPWGIRDSWEQYLMAMAQLHQSVTHSSSVSDRIMDFRQSLEDAVALLTDVRAAGADVAPAHASRLTAIIEAVDTFAAAEDL